MDLKPRPSLFRLVKFFPDFIIMSFFKGNIKKVKKIKRGQTETIRWAMALLPLRITVEECSKFGSIEAKRFNLSDKALLVQLGS